MHEIDVTLTDYLLAIETLWFAWQMHGLRTDSPIRRWSCFLFLALTGAAFVGGTVHGFIPDTTSAYAAIAWAITLILIGAAAWAAWAISAHLLCSDPVARWITRIAALEFLGYGWIVCFVSKDFLIAIINYAIPAVLLLAAFGGSLIREPSKPLLCGTLGMALTFVAAGVQSQRIDGLGLSHNALYHVLQGAGLACVFVALRFLSRGPAIQGCTTDLPGTVQP